MPQSSQSSDVVPKDLAAALFGPSRGFGYCERDITVDLLEALIVQHHAAITDPTRVGQLPRK